MTDITRQSLLGCGYEIHTAGVSIPETELFKKDIGNIYVGVRLFKTGKVDISIRDIDNGIGFFNVSSYVQGKKEERGQRDLKLTMEDLVYLADMVAR